MEYSEWLLENNNARDIEKCINYVTEQLSAVTNVNWENLREYLRAIFSLFLDGETDFSEKVGMEKLAADTINIDSLTPKEQWIAENYFAQQISSEPEIPLQIGTLVQKVFDYLEH